MIYYSLSSFKVIQAWRGKIRNVYKIFSGETSHKMYEHVRMLLGIRLW